MEIEILNKLQMNSFMNVFLSQSTDSSVPQQAQIQLAQLHVKA